MRYTGCCCIRLLPSFYRVTTVKVANIAVFRWCLVRPRCSCGCVRLTQLVATFVHANLGPFVQFVANTINRNTAVARGHLIVSDGGQNQSYWTKARTKKIKLSKTFVGIDVAENMKRIALVQCNGMNNGSRADAITFWNATRM